MTDPKLARFLVGLLKSDGWLRPRAMVLEPSAGDGAFVSALCANHCQVFANDIEVTKERERAWSDAGCINWSTGTFESLESGDYDAIVGNPPFCLAEAHVRHALSLLSHGGTLAFLLRLAFLETRDRIAFWTDHPAHCVYALSERPSFTGGGTDSTAYGMFVWRKGVRPRETALRVVSWGGANKKRALFEIGASK